MKMFLFLKKTAAITANRLDESNGSVENVLGMKTTTEKAPCFLRFAPKAKGLVSFVQNLLSPPDAKGGVCCGQVFAFFQSAAAAAVVLVGIGFLKAKKAVSAVAAAVVGIGLFLAPIDSAQANHGDIPVVLSVSLDDCFTPFQPTFNWKLSGVSDHWPLGYVTIAKNIPPSGFCLYDDDYVVVRLSRNLGWSPQLNSFVPSPSEWVEIWFWLGNDDFEPSAWVEDSEGNYYYVDLYVDDYGPWPTGRRN